MKHKKVEKRNLKNMYNIHTKSIYIVRIYISIYLYILSSTNIRIYLMCDWAFAVINSRQLLNYRSAKRKRSTWMIWWGKHWNLLLYPDRWNVNIVRLQFVINLRSFGNRWRIHKSIRVIHTLSVSFILYRSSLIIYDRYIPSNLCWYFYFILS